MDDDYKIKSLHIMLPQTSAYVKGFDGQIKWIHFLIKDDELLKKYNDIWNKVSNSMKKRFDSEPVYDKKNSESQNKIIQ